LGKVLDLMLCFDRRLHCFCLAIRHERWHGAVQHCNFRVSL
jgi:hypothetical protein